VRRTLAGLLFGLAYACASLTIAGFLLQRTAFDPDNSADAADVVLGDDAVKLELVNFIADNVAEQLKFDGAQMRQRVGQIADTEPGAKLMSTIIHDAHAHLIGDQEEPVTISPQQLFEVTRLEAALSVSPIELPVPTLNPLKIANDILSWMLPIAAIGTLLFAAIGFTAHPDKTALFQSLALGLLLLGVLAALLGYVVPKFLIPALDDTVWAHIPARLADDSLPLLIGLELLLVGGALAIFAGSGIMRRRRRWSTPVSTYRYNEERRWS
jgi:hypothetical protein